MKENKLRFLCSLGLHCYHAHPTKRAQLVKKIPKGHGSIDLISVYYKKCCFCPAEKETTY